MMKYFLKKGSDVVIIAGAHKGKKGKILKVFRETQKVLVEGVNLHKKHLKKTQENATGSIVEKEMPIHYSNVMALVESEKRAQKRSARSLQ
ncbi:MAG: 50S ribosomal protein L24 [Puniceicoccales bacterium]|jgi:large subunit ribosomal protein L24|nr:50S ribosomal protein L24 [Puniceicoccales bacterium]